MFTNKSLQIEALTYDYIAFNRNLEYVWVSDMTAQRMQKTRRSLLGRQLHHLYPDSTVYLNAFEQVLQSREPYSFEADASGWNNRLLLQVFPTDDGIEVFFEELDETWRARRDAVQLLELTRTLNAAIRLDDVVKEIFQFFGQNVQGIELALFDPALEALKIQYSTGQHADGIRVNAVLPIMDRGPWITTFQTGELLILDRVDFLERYPLADPRSAPTTGKMVTVALQAGGQMLGAMLLHLNESGVFGILQQSQLTIIAAQCASAILRTRQYEEVQHEGARFRTLLETTSAIILELDAEFQVRSPVPSWQAFTGQPFEEYRDFGYLNAVHPDDRLHYQGVFVNAAVTRQPFELRGRLRGWQGDDRDVIVQSVPIINLQGEISSWMGTVQDVTEQTRQRRWDQLTQDLLLKLNGVASSYDTYQVVLSEVAQMVGAERAVLFGPTHQNNRLELLSGYRMSDTQLDQVRTVLDGLSDGPSNLGEFSEPRWRQISPFPSPIDAQAEPLLLVPLLTEKTFVAQFALTFPVGVQPSETSLAFLEGLQPQLAPVLQRARLLRALELSEAQAHTILASLSEGIFLLNHNREVAATNPAFLKMFGLEIEVPFGGNFLMLLKEVRDVEDRPVRPEAYPAARAFQNHQAVRDEVLHLTLHNGVQLWVSMNAFPLQRPDGLWETVVSMADVTESVELKRQLELHALQDELTGLANRRVFSQTLEQVGTEEPTLVTSLLLLDVDQFKFINDTYGHAIGDEVLKIVADRLQSLLPSHAVLTRLGGDEYCVILRGVGSEAAARLGQRIIEVIQQPTRANDLAVQVAVSIGIAVNGLEGTTPTDLYRHADLALNSAKKLGVGQLSFYTGALSAAYLRTHQIERRMRYALLHREFQLYYQPVVDLRDASYCGFEALCRWQDEVLGWVNPAEFIPIAETTGLIDTLGLQLLELALEQCRTWTVEWGRPVHMNVNISAKQFIRSEFSDELFEVLVRSGVRPEQLTLEVTEAVVIHDLDEVVRQLEDLRMLGVQIALDDFGTGFSSLAVLERLPVDVLKVDRAMVAGVHLVPRRLELLRAVLLIAQTLGLTVVVEGVEELEELVVLREMACHRIQGYLISRPLPAAEVTRQSLRRWSEDLAMKRL